MNIQHKGLDRIEILSNQSEISFEAQCRYRVKRIRVRMADIRTQPDRHLLINGLNIL